MTPQLTSPIYQAVEAGVHLGRAAGDVHCRDSVTFDNLHHRFHCLAGHDLRSFGAGLHVTMATGLIAQLPHVDLNGVNATRFQRRVTRLAFSLFSNVIVAISVFTTLPWCRGGWVLCCLLALVAYFGAALLQVPDATVHLLPRGRLRAVQRPIIVQIVHGETAHLE